MFGGYWTRHSRVGNENDKVMHAVEHSRKEEHCLGSFEPLVIDSLNAPEAGVMTPISELHRIQHV